MNPSIRMGINLGNSLDAIGGEEAWGNPLTTRAMVEAYAARGFDTLRIPVSWSLHMTPDASVSAAWMRRVRQVVDWALDAGMNVILNTHHDNEQFYPSFAQLPQALPRLCAMWRQIGEAFADVDERLVLESLNEPRPAGQAEEWTGGTPESRQCLNAMNHAFVQAVRGSGGCNADRLLLVPTCAAAITPAAFDGFLLPKDPNIGLSLHTYDPRPFCFNHPEEHPVSVFGEAEERALTAVFADIARLAAPFGVPIYVTEFGAVTKVDGAGRHNDGEVARYARCFAALAEKTGVGCIWWDNNYYDAGDEWFGLMDRATQRWQLPETVAALLDKGGRKG